MSVGKSLCLDGNTAAAMSAYKLSDLAAIYPITPSSTMAELVEQWSAQGRKNLMGNVVPVRQAHAELGAAAAVHGAATAGALASTFTSSQGLLLMIPNLYFLGQQRLPAVIHLASRCVGTAATSLSPDHSDVYALQNTQVAMLSARCVQECHDIACISHAAAVDCSAPFVHFFEGFRVSHQFESFIELTDEQYAKVFDKSKLAEFKNNSLNPGKPDARGIGLGPEMYYAASEAQTQHFDSIPGKVRMVMDRFYQATGRKYEPFEYVGAPDAEYIIVMMGCASLTAEVVVENLKQKVGVIIVRLWRPFSAEMLIEKIPATVRKIAVLDRTRDFSSAAEPLYKEVLSALYKTGRLNQIEHVCNATYGVCGCDLTPGDVLAVFNSLSRENRQIMRIGVKDDILFNSILPMKVPKELVLLPPNTKELVLWGIGADGTIGACRNAMKILSDRKPNIESQANFEFDGKKSGGVTISYLRFGDGRIKNQYNPETADYVACHCQAYVGKYDMLTCAKHGGTFMLNANYENVEKEIPSSIKRQVAEKELKFYIADCNKIAEQVGLGNRISTVTVMFLLNVGMLGLLKPEECVDDMKTMAKITYAKQSAAVIEANMKAIEESAKLIDQCEYKYDRQKWLNASAADDQIAVKYGPATEADPLLKDGGVYDKLIRRDFASITCKDAQDFSSGIYPTTYGKFEKPGVSQHVVSWDSTNCIQCNQCAVICPHGCIHPFLSSEKKEGYVAATGKPNQYFKMQVSPLDCRGCSVCVGTCPKQCLSLKPLSEQVEKEQHAWDDAFENHLDDVQVDRETCNLKELQFADPYMLNPGSCPGCAESSIARMLTTLFGDRLVISSAVGCCLVWGHFNQLRPYMVDKNGRGPAVATSAFEDNALFGLGMTMAQLTHRSNCRDLVKAKINTAGNELKQALNEWLDNYENGAKSVEISSKLERLMREDKSEISQDLKEYAPYLVKRANWIIGGDGWSYDIDSAGVDHVMASGMNIKFLIFNNQCYANTGGQYSKATPEGAVAKHAYGGKETNEKHLAQMMMQYKNVYVAQIALGANKVQALRAMREAEAFNGPAMVICYCPCIAHNVKGGLTNSEKQQKLAVESGLWPLMRYDGKKLTIDSKTTKDVTEFTQQEQRFMGLKAKNPARYDMLLANLKKETENNLKLLQTLATIE